MGNKINTDQLTVIANLLALQLIHKKSLEDSAWILKTAGMKYTEIGKILGISEKAAAAHVSNRKSKQTKHSGKKAGGRASHE